MVTRYFYVDNKIKGELPFGDYGSGMKGLLPGVIEGIFALNPTNLIKGFAEGSEPWCKEIEKDVVKDNGQFIGKETRHVVLTDLDVNDLSESDKKKIQNAADCAGDGKTNCDSFSNINNLKHGTNNRNVKLSNVPNTYILSVSIFFIFILYKFMIRK